MDQPSSELEPHRVVAERVRALRTRNGWSAQRLAEEMASVGIPWERQVVTKLETGRRQSISVEELLALAYVLDVAPVHLLVPIDDETSTARYRVTPSNGPALSLGRARSWIRGMQPIKHRPGSNVLDGRRYFSEVPAGEYPHVPRDSGPPVSRAEAVRIREELDAWLVTDNDDASTPEPGGSDAGR